MDNNLVSVIIPCYNAQETIYECISSVSNQQMNGSIEILVVDDGSKDNSLNIIKEHFHNIVTILHKPADLKEQGASAARNRGLRAAKGKYICFLDSDDFYLPDFLKRTTQELDNDNDIGYVFCRQKFLAKDGVLKNWTRLELNTWDIQYHVLHRANVINTNSIVIRKSVIDKVGEFDTELRNGEDSDFWIRISEIAKGKFINFFGAVYRLDHSENQLTKTISNSAKLQFGRQVLLKALSRNLISDEIDKIRVLIILKNLIYTFLSQKVGKLFTIYRFLYSSIILFVIFPLTYPKYLFGLMKK
jgi:glycosyltransferase involved in cell wall biosynthesis